MKKRELIALAFAGFVIVMTTAGIFFYFMTKVPFAREFNPKEWEEREISYRKSATKYIRDRRPDIAVESLEQTVMPRNENNSVIDKLQKLYAESDDIVQSLEALRIRWEPDAALVEVGRKTYNTYCIACHGTDGKGSFDPTDASNLVDAPTDFSGESYASGKPEFKMKSTAWSPDVAPSDADIARVIRNGIPGTPMLAFEFSEKKVAAVTEFMKTYALVYWKYARRADELVPPEKPLGFGSEESVSLGRQLFKRACLSCHGDIETESPAMPGDLNSSRTIAGLKIRSRVRNLARDALKHGTGDEELYKTIALGLGGTPMGANSSLTSAELWNLVSYIKFVRKNH